MDMPRRHLFPIGPLDYVDADKVTAIRWLVTRHDGDLGVAQVKLTDGQWHTCESWRRDDPSQPHPREQMIHLARALARWPSTDLIPGRAEGDTIWAGS